MPDLPSVGLLLVFVGFWAGISLLWTPFLASAAVHRLFDGWPTSRLPVNYALGMGAATFVHFVAVVVALAVVAGRQGANLLEFLRLVVGLTVGFVAVTWTGVSVGLPQFGRWQPADEGMDGRLVLAVGAVWYLLCTALVAGFVSLVGFVFAFPG